jgi:hypothetical protein
MTLSFPMIPKCPGIGISSSQEGSTKADLLILHCPRWAIVIATVFLGFGYLYCTRNPASVPEAEYATKTVGSWEGAVGDERDIPSRRQSPTLTKDVAFWHAPVRAPGLRIACSYDILAEEVLAQSGWADDELAQAICP